MCQWLAGGQVVQRFHTSQRRIRHMHKFCAAKEFGRCPLAAVMNCAYAPWLRSPAPVCDGIGQGGGGWRNKQCEAAASNATIEPDGRGSRSAAGGSVTPTLPVAEKGGVEEAGEKEQCER